MKYYVFNTKTMSDVAIVDTVEEMINTLAELTKEDAGYLANCWKSIEVNSMGYRGYEVGEVED